MRHELNEYECSKNQIGNFISRSIGLGALHQQQTGRWAGETGKNIGVSAAITCAGGYLSDRSEYGERTRDSDGLRILAESLEQRDMKPFADIHRERHRLRVTEYLNRLAGGVNNQATVPAAGKMLLEVGLYAGVKTFFEITRQFKYDFLAVHCVHPVENIYSVSGGASTVPAKGAILPPLRKFPGFLPSLRLK